LCFDHHAVAAKFEACAYVWYAVHDHHAGGAVAYGAEEAARAFMYGAFGYVLKPGGVEGDGYGHVVEGFDFFSVEDKRYGFAMLEFKDGVGFDIQKEPLFQIHFEDKYIII